MSGDHPTSRGLSRGLWVYAARRARHGFVRHRGIDSAAALTFFSSLALFPGALVLVSTLAVASSRADAERALLAVIGEVATTSTEEAFEDPLAQLVSIPNPGIALAIGIVVTLWTFSGYATAFGRAVNTVYEVQEGRRPTVFRAIMLLVAGVVALAFALITVILLVTPRVANAIAATAGFGEPWISLWNIGKWPVLAVVAAVVVGVLYYFTPNIRHSRLRWVSYGAAFAILAWSLATIGFAGWVLTVGQYDRVYGWLGGALVLLLWLYLTNLVLVFGAEVDAEIVRARQLSAGLPSEEVIDLPARDTTRTLLIARQRAEDVALGRALREDAERAARDHDSA